MNPDHPAIDRRLELLLDRALQGLDPAEAAELATSPLAEADLTAELAAAAVVLARLDPGGLPDLPPALAARVEREARRHLRPPGSPVRTRPAAWRRVGPWLGWAAAAAALAVLVLDRPGAPPPEAPPPVASNLPADPPRAAPSALLVATEHPLARGAGGSVAWDQARQEGTLRVDGLAPVDPRSGCYQLWIFDATRDGRYPVDGGTFLVDRATTGGVVGIRPRIPIRRPTLFAVTLEPPGGVVVSDRDRLLLTATWTAPAPSEPPPPPAPRRDRPVRGR